MARTAIVQDYRHPQPGTSSTLSVDEKIQREILNNGIEKPKGYTVSYHANPEVEKMHFGQKHPMKPWRLTLTNKIVMAYGMHEELLQTKSWLNFTRMSTLNSCKGKFSLSG